MEGGNPGQYLDKLMYIRSNASQATSSYYELFLKHGRSEMLQQACEIALEQVQPYQFDVLKQLNLLPLPKSTLENLADSPAHVLIMDSEEDPT